MTYVTDTVDYQPYILVGLALILALIVLAIFIIKGKMNQQLEEMKKISALLEKGGVMASEDPNVSQQFDEPVAGEIEPDENLAEENIIEAADAPAADAPAAEQELQQAKEYIDEPQVDPVNEIMTEQVPEDVPAPEFATEPEVMSQVMQAKTGEFVFNDDAAPKMPAEESVPVSEPVFSEDIPSYEIPYEEKGSAMPEEEITGIDDIQFPDEMMQQSQPAGSQVVIDDLQNMPADEPAPAEKAAAWQEPLFGEFAQPESRVHMQPEQPVMPQSQPAYQQPQMPEQPVMPQSQPAYQQPQMQEQPQVQQKPSKNRMTFDTAKSGRTYDKSEIESIIKN